MASVDTENENDWMACELIEQIPGKVSWRPIVRGTRILPDTIVGSYDQGEMIDELCVSFPALSVQQIQLLIALRPIPTRTFVKVLSMKNSTMHCVRIVYPE